MFPNASQIKELAYVSESYEGTVRVYDYQMGTLVGKLTGFSNPQGQCVGASGNVFIADRNEKIAEYVRGAKRALKTLKTGGATLACSVAPDGDLAVANYYTPTSFGDVVIFKGGSSRHRTVSNPNCYNVAGVGYDDHNNLYVEAQPKMGSNVSTFCEIPYGSTTMRTVTSNAPIRLPIGVMWDGKHITLADGNYGYPSHTVVYQMKETSSGNLDKVGMTVLTNDSCGGHAQLPQPFIVGYQNTPINKQLGVAIAGESYSCQNLDVWRYPSGGIPRRSFKADPESISGESVSIAP
jgi:hypothetical protein